MSTFFTMVSYLGIIGDMISPAIGQWMGGTNEDFCSVWADRRIAMTAALAIVCPLSVMKNIDSLKYTSFFAIVAIAYLTIVVVVRSGEGMKEAIDFGDQISFAELSEDIFRALPIVTLAYTCQFNLFPIISTLKNPSTKRINTFVATSLTSCFLVYIVIGTFGYLTFFGEVKGNILLNYDPSDPFIMVGRLAVALVIIFSFPLLAHPCFGTMDEILFNPEVWGYSSCRKAIIMGVMVAIQYVIAMFVPDISVPLGIAGSTGSTAVSFILPSLFYMKLSPKPRTSCPKVASMILFIIG
eukprot:gene17970-35255_t